MPFLRPRGPRCRFGLLLAVLALLGQALGPAPVLSAAQDAFADVPICHAGTPPGDEAPPGHAPRRPPCALCPACHLLAAAAVLPVPASTAVPPLAPPARPAPPPPARGPPGTPVRASAYPTGPPPRLA